MSDIASTENRQFELTADVLHVWAIPLDVSRIDERWFEALDEYEQERANKFRFKDHRRRFLVAHHEQRSILARYINVTPNDIEFHHGAHGKPSLQNPLSFDLRFNLSHSNELAVLALTVGREIGVDIEWVARPLTFDGVAERFFFPSEAKIVQETHVSRKARVFYEIWTRKESYLKARGVGLGLGPELFYLTSDEGESTAFRICGMGDFEHDRWRVWEIPGLSGYAAALTVEGTGPLSIRVQNWPIDRADALDSSFCVSLD